MNTMRSLLSAAALCAILSLLVYSQGCGATGDTSTDPDGDGLDGDSHGDGDNSDGDGGLTVRDIQDETSPNHPFPGSNVELRGVIATSAKIVVSPSSNLRGFFISDPGGGEYSGLLIVMKGDIDFDSQVGDELTVRGVYVEFCGVGDSPSEYCSSQIELTQVPEVTGDGDAPAPHLVSDPASIATGGPLMYVWEHSLVQVRDVVVTNPDLGFGEFELTGGLRVDDMIYAHTPVQGQEISSLTGFLYIAFGSSKLEPRSADDVVTGPIVNPDDLTLADIQNPDSPKHPSLGPVTVKGIVVTSAPFQVSSSGLMGAFVSDVGGGEWTGCLLTWKPTTADAENGYDPPALAPGKLIDVTGSYNEFCGTDDTPDEYCSTQIELTPFQGETGSVTDAGATADVPDAATVDPASVKTGGSLAEQWQDSLIRVVDVNVTNDELGHGEFEITGGLTVDDILYSYDLPEVGTSYTSLTGFLYTSFDAFKLEPRSADDMQTGGGPDGDTDGDIEPSNVSIADIQNPSSANHPDPGPVVVNGIVVTSDVFQVSGSGLKGIFVSDVGGGPFSGCMLTWKPTSVDAQNGYDPPAMSPGQLIDVRGSYEEFCGTGDTPDQYCSTQIALTPFDDPKGSVTLAGGTEDVPEATIVDPEDVKTGGPDSERWQHSLIRVVDVNVTRDDLGFGEFEITGGLTVDDILYHYNLPTVGAGYDSLTGFLYTSFNAFKLVPRSESDMVLTGADGDLDVDLDEMETDGDLDPDPEPEEEDTTPPKVVINEILYNDEGTDGETIFTELYGPPGTSLNAYKLVGINGPNGAVYRTISLIGKTIPADGYFVIAHGNTTLPGSAYDYLDNNIDWTNGPDAVQLRKNENEIEITVDAVAYGNGALGGEGAPAANISGERSLARIPDHVDSNDNSEDFVICDSPTPGTPNDCGQADGDVDTTDGDIDTDGPVIINEIYYDEPSSDTGATLFIELHGPGGKPLSDYSLVAVNGTGGSTYRAISLIGRVIPSDGYFVIVHANANGALSAVGDWVDNGVDLQNGPDSLILQFNGIDSDIVGYGGSGDGPSESAPAAIVPAGSSLARNPDHSDSNNNSADFASCSAPTPGASNDSCFQ